MYAIIATGGKQYTVKEGDIVRVEKLDAAVGDAVTFDQVLYVGGDNAKVGDPTVAGATVSASVLNQGKAKKVIVYKYIIILQRLVKFPFCRFKSFFNLFLALPSSFFKTFFQLRH